MQEDIKIYQLQYLINKTGINGNYDIKDVKNTGYDRGSSDQTNWTISENGDKIEFSSKLICNDIDPPSTKFVLKFEYLTEYQIHHGALNKKSLNQDQKIWNITELLYRHRCLIQQLFIDNKEFKRYGFPQTTESFYHNYQEVKVRTLANDHKQNN